MFAAAIETWIDLALFELRRFFSFQMKDLKKVSHEPRSYKKDRNGNMSMVTLSRMLNLLRCFKGRQAPYVTRLGYFWKFLAIISLTKVAQKDIWLLGYFEKEQCKKCCGYYLLLETFGKLFNTASGHTGPAEDFPQTTKIKNYHPK